MQLSLFTEPANTVKAYKLFRTKGGKLYPLYVHADKPIVMRKWLKAEMGERKDNGKVKSKIGELAFRPGWHSGDLPIATHIGGKSQGKDQKKPDYRPDDQVWALVEVAADVDWQTEAYARAEFTKKGNMIARTAHITDQLPIGGFYRYKTNNNMTGNWLISGEVRVKRILTDGEVKQINDAHGVADLPRKRDL